MTVADLITSALRILGVCAAGEVPSSEEQTNAFSSLNDLLDSWDNERLAVYQTVRTSYTLQANHQPHTIGSGGDFNTTRPLRIERASIVLASSANAELPLSVVDFAAWQLTQGKVTTGIPVTLWPEDAYPLMKLWLNPIPINADNIILYTWQQLTRFSATSSTVDLPPGYARALRFNLAKELAPEYGVKLSEEAVDTANESRANVKRGNSKPAFMRSDAALLRPGPFNIISGDRE